MPGQEQWSRSVDCSGPPRYMKRTVGKRERGRVRPGSVRKRMGTTGAADPPDMGRKRGSKSAVAPPHMIGVLPLCVSGDTVSVGIDATLSDTDLEPLEMPFLVKRRAGFRKGLRLH